MVGTLDNIRLNAFYFLASLNDRLDMYFKFIKNYATGKYKINSH